MTRPGDLFVRWLIGAVALGALAFYLSGAAWAQPPTRIVIDSGNRFTAVINDLGATLTEIKAAPSSSAQALFITDIIIGSSTATAGTFALRSGTGAACAGATTGVLPQFGIASPSATYAYPGSATIPIVITFQIPIRLPVGHALCAIGTATNLARGQVNGFTGAP